MDSRKDYAVELWKKGLNCAQAVCVAYADLINIDENVLFAVSEGFGSGISGLKKTCGALSGAVILAGCKTSSNNINTPTTKLNTYKLGKTILDDFKDTYGSLDCQDLKGLNTGKVLLPCQKCIEEACLLVEKHIFKDEFNIKK